MHSHSVGTAVATHSDGGTLSSLLGMIMKMINNAREILQTANTFSKNILPWAPNSNPTSHAKKAEATEIRIIERVPASMFSNPLGFTVTFLKIRREACITSLIGEAVYSLFLGELGIVKAALKQFAILHHELLQLFPGHVTRLVTKL